MAPLPDASDLRSVSKLGKCLVHMGFYGPFTEALSSALGGAEPNGGSPGEEERHWGLGIK